MSETGFNNGSANIESAAKLQADAPQAPEVLTNEAPVNEGLTNNTSVELPTASSGSPVPVEPAVPGIEARDITVTYRNGHTALRDASFSIPNATICALVGVNGSGKSTLFKAIMGFVPLASGSVNILGKPAGRALKRNTVAYVPQNEDVDWDFPVLVEDVVMMGRYGHMGLLRRPSKEDRKQVEAALVRVCLLYTSPSPRD